MSRGHKQTWGFMNGVSQLRNTCLEARSILSDYTLGKNGLECHFTNG